MDNDETGQLYETRHSSIRGYSYSKRSGSLYLNFRSIERAHKHTKVVTEASGCEQGCYRPKKQNKNTSI